MRHRILSLIKTKSRAFDYPDRAVRTTDLVSMNIELTQSNVPKHKLQFTTAKRSNEMWNYCYVDNVLKNQILLSILPLVPG